MRHGEEDEAAGPQSGDDGCVRKGIQNEQQHQHHCAGHEALHEIPQLVSGKLAIQELHRKLHGKYDEELLRLVNKKDHDSAGKLRFNINRSELLHLMLVLKDSDIIDKDTTDYALAHFIENVW